MKGGLCGGQKKERHVRVIGEAGLHGEWEIVPDEFSLPHNQARKTQVYCFFPGVGGIFHFACVSSELLRLG